MVGSTGKLTDFCIGGMTKGRYKMSTAVRLSAYFIEDMKTVFLKHEEKIGCFIV